MESQIGDKIRQTEARRKHWMRKPGFIKSNIVVDEADNIRKTSIRKFRSQDDLDVRIRKQADANNSVKQFR